MFKNYLIVAWRNLAGKPLHTIINIAGLAIGVTICFTIFLIVQYETGFNIKHPEADRIYRVYTEFSGAINGTNRGVPRALPGFIKEKFTGIETVANFHTWSAKIEIPYPNSDNKELERDNKIALAGPGYLGMMKNYDWLAGDPSNALSKPNQVVITQAKGEKYFGNVFPQEMLQKEIIYADSLPVVVSGVIKEVPDHSDFAFTDLISFSTIETSWLKRSFSSDDWLSTNSSTQLFLKLSPGTKKEEIEDQLVLAEDKYSEINERADWQVAFKMQPLSDLHFNSELGIFDFTSYSPADKDILNILILVGIAIILIAAVNFINLETAQASKRVKEVGIRKVLGSSKGKLMTNFLSESLVVTACAVVISIPLIKGVLVFYKDFIPEGVTFDFSIENIFFLIGIIIILGLIAGLYPAFVMSSFKPANAIKGKNGGNLKGTGSGMLRKGLIIFQFTFSQILIAGTLVIVSQMNFMVNKDLGFSKESILQFRTPWYEEDHKKETLKNKILELSEINELSTFQQAPAITGYSSSVSKYQKNGEEIITSLFIKRGDSTYIPFFRIKLIAGRNLIPKTESRELVINEKYMKELGYEDPYEVLSEEVTISDDAYTIVGVIKDFHFRSLHHVIKPMAILYEQDANNFGIKINPKADKQTIIEKITNIWELVYPDIPFNYSYLDESIRKFYQSEEKTLKLVTTGMGVAIFISCLGLFGLASFTALQRTKEIGIRKVLGATAENIVRLLSWDFLKLVLAAFLLAAPVSWFVAEQWLVDFAYRIPFGVWILIATGSGAVLITFVTVGYQAIKAALINPASSLRYE